MNLYRITLVYGHNYDKYNFLVVAGDVQSAIDLSMTTFRRYGYGCCRFKQAELLASEGQYSEADVLLIQKA